MTQKTPATGSGKVGFISLGCPKALVDSERILTQLRLDGYDVVPTYDDADIVVVNTCGFIDAAKQESLDAIGEAINENGKVIVTGCMGWTLKRSGKPIPVCWQFRVPRLTRKWWAQSISMSPKKDHDPFVDLVPPQGIKLTPRHYAYLKISEGCNHSCTFCIIRTCVASW